MNRQVQPIGRVMVRAAVAGALTVLPLPIWILVRTYPFNTLPLEGRLGVAAFFVLPYLLAGAMVGLGLGAVAATLTRRRVRGWSSTVLPLLAVLVFWVGRDRLHLLAGSDLAAGAFALGVSLLLAILARFALRGRGAAVATTVGLLLLLGLGVVVARGGASTMPRDPALQDRLADLGPPPPRVVVFALDGVEEEILLALMEAGEVPHLRALCARAAHGRLTTLEPTWSPPIWTTMWTGRLPVDHGITYFVSSGTVRLGPWAVVVPRLLGAQRVAGALLPAVSVPVNQRQRRSTAVWEALGLAGRSSVLANRILSWPALPVRGVELTERLARLEEPVAGEAFPPELADVARARLTAVPPNPDPALEAVPWLAIALAREAELWRMASQQAVEHDAALVLLYTHLIDSAQHRLLKYHWPERFRFEVDPADLATFGPVISATYRQVDAMVGEALATLGEGSRILVISDHGVRPNLELDHDPGEPRGALRMPPASEAEVSGVHGHAPDGIFLLAGPGVRPGRLSWQPHALEIAPLLLDLLGLPPAADLPRRSPLRNHPELLDIPRQDPVLSYEGWIPRQPGAVASTSDPMILEELRALGYID